MGNVPTNNEATEEDFVGATNKEERRPTEARRNITMTTERNTVVWLRPENKGERVDDGEKHLKPHGEKTTSGGVDRRLHVTNQTGTRAWRKEPLAVEDEDR